jgi:hypothetical protein
VTQPGQRVRVRASVHHVGYRHVQRRSEASS